MNTITDSGLITGSLLASNYSGLTTASAASVALAPSRSAGKLQKMLSTLDSIETALDSFKTGKSRHRSASGNALPAPATSARLESREEINPTTPGDASANKVNPASAFDGSTGNSPNLESGYSVDAGSFKINGTEIVVAADSTIYSVLSSINVSTADVTASYNSVEEKIVFTHNTLGAGSAIELSDDSSGFLQATKLDGAVLVQGTEADNAIDNAGAKTRSYKTADLLIELEDTLAGLLDAADGLPGNGSQLQTILNAVVDDMYADFGKTKLQQAGIDFSAVDSQFLVLSNNTRRRLVHGLQDGDRYLLSALTGTDNGKKGLIPALQESIQEYLGSGGSNYVKGSFTSYRA